MPVLLFHVTQGRQGPVTPPAVLVVVLESQHSSAGAVHAALYDAASVSPPTLEALVCEPPQKYPPAHRSHSKRISTASTCCTARPVLDTHDAA